MDNVIDYHTGSTYTLALKADGTVWHCGMLPVSGQYATTPTKTTFSNGTALTNIIDIAGGNNYAVALRADGTVWAWGTNLGWGLNGDGVTTTSAYPLQVRDPSHASGYLQNVVSLAPAREGVISAIKGNSTAWSWSKSAPSGLTQFPTLNITALSQLGNTRLLRYAAGVFYSDGDNTYGQLGRGPNGCPAGTACSVGGINSLPNSVLEIVSGRFHAFAIAANGTVWSWGRNDKGQLGKGITGAPDATPTATAVKVPTTWPVANAMQFTLAIGASGKLRASGDNSLGSLGIGSFSPVRVTSPVDVALTGTVSSIAAGYLTAVAAMSNGGVRAWGFNSDGQVGNNTLADQPTPVLVGWPVTNTVAVASSMWTSYALKADGTVYAWGKNTHGQIGDGTSTSRHVPTKINSLSNIVAIDADGQGHAMALSASGEVWSWGVGGTVGDNTTITRYSPVKVAQNAKAITAGDGSGHFITASGTIYGWGVNSQGAVGDGTATNRLYPVPLSGISNATAISAGRLTGHATTASGGFYGWGYNSFGTIGDGTTLNRFSPVPLWATPVSVVLANEGNTLNSFVTFQSGGMAATGYNSEGNFGNASTVNQNGFTTLTRW